MPARSPRLLTPDSVRQSVLSYVQRYAAPRAQTRRRWAQRIARQVATTGEEAAPLLAALDAALDLGERYRYVDDAAFAASRSRRALARGVSPGRVESQLTARGVSRAVAHEAVTTEGGPDAALESARALVRRRKLGPWRPPAERKEHHQRDLATLARAGFGYRLALQALAEPEEADEEA